MNIGINIVERKPIVNGSPRIICGNSGDTITFTFDSEWSKYTAKVARFVYVKNGVVEPQEVLFNGNVVEIPVLSNITEVYIGVYAGELRTTTPVTIPCDFSILCKGGEPVDPTPDIYAQILDALNAKLILEGNAQSATKLETPRTIQVDLEKSDGASFDGTEDVTPGVTGVLPIENGGTGANTPTGVLKNLGINATLDELNYVHNVTGPIQEQLNEKSESNHTHTTVNSTTHGFMSSTDKLKLDVFPNLIEDSDNSGCYYRMVNGEKEWLNPPLKQEVEYRTTERMDGYAVYKSLKFIGRFNAGTTQHIENQTVKNYQVFKYESFISGGSPLPYDSTNNSQYNININVGSNGVLVELGSSAGTDVQIFIIFHYIKG